MTEPIISFHVYISLIITLLLSFTLLSLRPPTSINLYLKLCLIASIYASIPIIFGSYYPCIDNLSIPVLTFTFLFKMMIWLKKTYKFIGKKKEEIKKIKFIPFWLTLFNWRRNDLNRHNQKNQKNTTQTLLLLTSKKVNSLLFLSIINFIPKLIIREILAHIIEYLSPEVPERSYVLRILDYLYTPTKISTISTITSPYILFYCYLYGAFLYQNMDYLYHLFKVFSAILLWIIHRSHSSYSSSNYHMNIRSYHHDHHPNNSYNITIIHMTYYLYSLLTTTPQLFNKPFLSQNPKDLWSKRWHQMYRSSFTELGYFPIMNFFEKFKNSSLTTFFNHINSTGKFYLVISNFIKLLRRLGSLLGYKTFLKNIKIQKDIQTLEIINNQNDEFLKNEQNFKNNGTTTYNEISRALAVIGSFFWSAILHEYLFIGLFGWNNSRGEHFSFFLVHALIMIIWDILSKLFNRFWKLYYHDNDNDNYEKIELKKTEKILFMIKKVLGFIIWNFILTLTLPLFIEPYIRLRHFYCIPHLGCQRKI